MPFFNNKRKDFSIQPPKQQVDGTPFFVTDSANIDFTLANLNLTANLTTTGITAGTYGDATHIPVLTLDSYGRVTGVSTTTFSATGIALEVNGIPNLSQTILNLVDSATIAVVDLGGGDIEFNYIGTGGLGTVTSVSAGTGMSFTTITTSGSVAIDTTKVPYIPAGFSTGLLKWDGTAWVFDNSTYLTTISGLNISLLTNDSGYITSAALTGYVPYTGATSNVDLGIYSFIANDGIYNTEMSPSFFGVENAAATIFALLEYNQLTLSNSVLPSSLSVSATGITFPDLTVQTTAAYSLTTKGDLYTFDTTNTRLPVGNDTYILIADSSTPTGLKWGSNTTPPASGYYGQYFSYVSQSATTANVGKAMIFGTLDLSNGITVVSDGTNDTKITFANAGIYNLQFSTQFQNTDNAQHDIYIWLRKNGTTSAADVTGSTGLVSVPARKSAGAGNEGHIIVSWNFLLDVASTDFYQIIWATSDITHVTIQFYAGNPPPPVLATNYPSTASTLFTVTQQAGILAGTGITGLGKAGFIQTGATQTLVEGTSGTDFNIVSSSNTQTFNIPSASALNRGLLLAADWTIFNNKVSTTRSINTTSPLSGGGDLSADRTLSIADAAADGSTKGAAAFVANDFNASAGVISIDYTNGQAASSVNKGFLTAADWNTFNSYGSSTYKNTTDSAAVTGTTLNTKVTSQLVTANRFLVGDILQIKARTSKVGTAGLMTLRIYINTADSLTVPPATLISTSTTNTNAQINFGIDKNAVIKSATVTQTMNALSNAIFLDPQTSNVALTNSNIDWTVNQYIIFAIQNAANGDSTLLSYYQIIKQ